MQRPTFHQDRFKDDRRDLARVLVERRSTVARSLKVAMTTFAIAELGTPSPPGRKRDC